MAMTTIAVVLYACGALLMALYCEAKPPSTPLDHPRTARAIAVGLWPLIVLQMLAVAAFEAIASRR